jgi:hypothetical protein
VLYIGVCHLYHIMQCNAMQLQLILVKSIELTFDLYSAFCVRIIDHYNRMSEVFMHWIPAPGDQVWSEFH